MRADLRHGGTKHENPEVPTAPVLGVIARNDYGVLCFFSSFDADGVELTDTDALWEALLSAPEREIAADVLKALDGG